MLGNNAVTTYLKTGERDDIENCCLRAFGPQATIFNVFSFPCFEVRDNHTMCIKRYIFGLNCIAGCNCIENYIYSSSPPPRAWSQLRNLCPNCPGDSFVSKEVATLFSTAVSPLQQELNSISKKPGRLKTNTDLQIPPNKTKIVMKTHPCKS